MSKIPEWIYFYSGGTPHAKCERCKQSEPVPLPMLISAFVKWSEYFGDKHRFCKATAPIGGKEGK